MGAHSTPGAAAPTGARIATTTLAIAATSVLGAGTALAHDDSGHHGHGDSHASTWEHGSEQAWQEAAQARAEADDSLRDVLAEVGMDSWDTDDQSSSSDDDPSWEDGTSDDPAHPSDPGDGSTHAATQQVSAPAPARPATSTQPIAAPAPPPASGVPAALPAPGETQTIPIRGTR